MRRFQRSHTKRERTRHAGAAPRFVAAILLGGLLPGCPLSDAYFVDPNSGQGTGGGDLGGTGGTDSGKAGQDPAGTGGRSGPGGRSNGGAPAAGTGGAVASGTGGSSGSSMKCEAMERCDGLDNDCNDEIDEGDACPASCSAQQYDGHAYVLCVSTAGADAVTADQASMRCTELAKGPGSTMELAWLESSDENAFVQQWIADTAPSDGVVWMGATDQMKEGVWVWGRRPDAVQFYEVTKMNSGPYMGRFSDFGEGQPGSNRGIDEDCGAFDARVDWHWSDRECAEPMVGYVCEQQSP